MFCKYLLHVEREVNLTTIGVGGYGFLAQLCIIDVYM